MTSIWRMDTKIPRRPRLEENLKCDAAIIGCGLAGALSAYFLQKRGLNTIVLEAGRIGCGQTQNTTAKITSQHNLIYAGLVEDFGMDKAAQYAEANQQAIQEYRWLIKKEQINCQFQELPAYLYSTLNAEPLEKEAEAARNLGIPASLTKKTALPFAVAGALRFEKQGQFHPLKFLQAIIKTLNIYEESRAVAVKGQDILTPHGALRAEKIIFAAHYPFIKSHGLYFARMHQEHSYVLALEQAAALDGMYLSVDRGGYSFRNSGDLLLLGGGGHRTGENSAGNKYAALRKAAAKFYPQSREKAFWSAQDCMTLDKIPYIGEFSAATPNWYVATGFNKWGMTTSMAAALILADLITGKNNPFGEIFSPWRFKLSAAGKNLAYDGGQALKGLARQIFALPKEYTATLPLGHGGIVEYEGHKIGAYKDEKGEVHLVPTACPHLGCQLEWNPDEKSWDCPCHGSRFDYKGRLLDSPANGDLRPEN